MATASTPALQLLAQASVPYVVREYELPGRQGRARDERPSYGLEAAAALGVDPARVLKTLVASADDRLAVAVIAVAAELDLKALATACGARRATLADPRVAERASGSVVGGISPLGLRRPLPIVIDGSALEHDTVLVSAGRRGLQVELAPHDLVRVIHATVARIARAV